MGSGAFQPEVTASNTAPVGSDGESLRLSRCLIACAKQAGGARASSQHAGGRGANQHPCGQTPLTPSAERARMTAWHDAEPTPGTSNGVSPGINKILSVGGTVQLSHLFFPPQKEVPLGSSVIWWHLLCSGSTGICTSQLKKNCSEQCQCRLLREPG